MRKCLPAVVAFVGVMVLFGCGGTPKHTNTLIFGTNTKFAFDVGADPTGVTSVTVGYKRQEAVWMPLLANKGKDREYEPAVDCVATGCLFQGSTNGGTNGDKDAYSVLASFGASFSGEGQASGAKAGGGIAQYFATGLAARELARAGGAQLVSIQPEGTIRQQAEALIKVEQEDLVKILAYVNTDGKVDDARLAKLVVGTNLDANWMKDFAGKPISTLRTELEGPSRVLVAPMAKNIKE